MIQTRKETAGKNIHANHTFIYCMAQSSLTNKKHAYINARKGRKFLQKTLNVLAQNIVYF